MMHRMTDERLAEIEAVGGRMHPMEILNTYNELLQALKADRERIKELERDKQNLITYVDELRARLDAVEAALEQEKKYDIEKQRDLWADNCRKAWSQRDAAIARYEAAEARLDAVKKLCENTWDEDDHWVSTYAIMDILEPKEAALEQKHEPD